MSFYGGEFFGSGFFAYYHEEPYSGKNGFYGGEFFGAGFFYAIVEDEAVRTGGKGDDSDVAPKRKSIYKPTGLPPYRETVERRVKETREIAREVAREVLHLPKPVKRMSLSEIDSEIAVLMQKKLRTEDEEIVLMLLLAVAG